MGNKKLSLTEILANSTFFGEIVNKAEQLARLNRIVHQKLDPELAKYCRVANLRDGILILTTHSPSYGHLLRFSTVELLTALRADPSWCHLKSIKTLVRERPPASRSLAALLPIPYLSKPTADIIQYTARNIDNPSLQKALLRLSTRLT